MNPIPKNCTNTPDSIPIIVLRNKGDQLIVERTCYKMVEGICTPCHCSSPISPDAAYGLFICNKDVHIAHPCKGFDELMELYEEDDSYTGCCLNYKPDLYEVNFLVELLRQSVPIHKDDVKQLAEYFGPCKGEFIVNGFTLEDDYWFFAESAMLRDDSPGIRRMKSAVLTRAILSSVFLLSFSVLCLQWNSKASNLPLIQEVFGSAEVNVRAYKDLFYGIFPYTVANKKRIEWEFGSNAVAALEKADVCLEYGYSDIMQFHFLDDGNTAPGACAEAINAFCEEFGDEDNITPTVTIYSSRLSAEGMVGGCDVTTIDLKHIGTEHPQNWMDKIYSEWVDVYNMSYRAIEKSGFCDVLDEKWDELYRRPGGDDSEL